MMLDRGVNSSLSAKGDAQTGLGCNFQRRVSLGYTVQFYFVTRDRAICMPVSFSKLTVADTYQFLNLSQLVQELNSWPQNW